MLIENTEMPKYWEITQIDQIQVLQIIYFEDPISQDYGDRKSESKSIFVVKWV